MKRLQPRHAPTTPAAPALGSLRACAPAAASGSAGFEREGQRVVEERFPRGEAETVGRVGWTATQAAAAASAFSAGDVALVAATAALPRLDKGPAAGAHRKVVHRGVPTVRAQVAGPGQAAPPIQLVDLI